MTRDEATLLLGAPSVRPEDMATTAYSVTGRPPPRYPFAAPVVRSRIMRTRTMRPVADLRGVRCAPWGRRSTLCSMFWGTGGLGIVEVLAVTVIVGIAVIGVALMFGKGSAWVAATGADRVAAGLAQQRIEQIRTCGWDVATADPPAPNCPALPGVPPLVTGLGVLPPEPSIQAGNVHTFTRTVCIQYVDPKTPQGLGEPAFAPPACSPGTATPMVRITVVVSSSQPETSPVTLQAWMHCLESRPSTWVWAPCPSQVAQ
jgi:type II secretory pathway pseudopilin PulG